MIHYIISQLKIACNVQSVNYPEFFIEFLRKNDAGLQKTVDFPSGLWYNILCDRVGRSRDMWPKGIIMRKVRASQGRITDNVRRG